MASIRQLPNGSYQATVYVGRDAKGKQLRKYITRDKWHDCNAAAKKLEVEIEEKRFINIENTRFSTWMDKWLELNESRLAPSTYLSYKTYVDVHFKPSLGKLKLSQINEIHLKQYMSDKLKTPSKNDKSKNLSVSYVRKHMFVLKEMLNDVLKHKSPANDIKLPSKEDFMPHVITDFELSQIYNAFDNPKHKLIILLSATCGLRRGEIFGLKWDDITWGEGKGSIRIDESRSLSKDGYIDKNTKTKNGMRNIAVSDQLLSSLKEYRKNLKKASKYIFTGRPDNFSCRFAEVIQKNNLPHVRFHDLRHYHASWLYSQDVPDHYAAERMGHDINVLKGIYQHLNLDRKKEIDNNIRSLKFQDL